MKSKSEKAQARVKRRLEGKPSWKERQMQRVARRAKRLRWKREFKQVVALVERAKAQRLKVYVKTDEHGNVVAFRRSHFPPSEGWQHVDNQRDMDELMVRPTRVRRGERRRDGRRNEMKPEIRLTVDAPRFVADGKDRFQAMVVGVPDGMGPVKVTVNGALEEWEPATVYGYSSDAPGQTWLVRVSDARFFCEKPGFTVTSVAVDEPREPR
jgi:hypothetical protein